MPKAFCPLQKMEDCNLVQTPLEARIKFSQQEGPLVNFFSKPYRDPEIFNTYPS